MAEPSRIVPFLAGAAFDHAMRKLATVICCLMLMAGCSRSATQGEIALSAVPADLKDCGRATAPASLTIHWDASNPLRQGGSVQLWINNNPADQGVFGGSNHGKLWVQSGAAGTATTGRWTKPGTRITMTDTANGNVLARLDVGAAPCQ